MLQYAITDRRRLGATETERTNALVEQAARLAGRGDVDYLQLREKDLPSSELAVLARRILEAVRTHARNPSQRPELVINSRADIAIAVRANGVHLTSSPGELTPVQVRELYSGAGLLPPTISLSCHTLAEVIAARGLKSEDDLCFAPDPANAPDLILFGPVFEKRVAHSCPSESADQLVASGSALDLLRQACAAAAPVPVLALGGVTEENAADCLAAGAAGVAGIRLFV